MTQVRKSLGFLALDNNVALLLQIISTVIIARILTPSQVGVFAVAAVFFSLASSFRDFGVAEYLIQEKHLDDDTIRAALTVNIGISWLMALLLLVLSPLASDFYREPGVGQVMRLQAVNFLLIPFGAVTVAWFRREMNFKPILLSNMTSNIASFATSVTLALMGFGYMALAWGSLVNTVAAVAITTFMRPAGFPRWPGTRGIKKVLHFGKFASGIYLFFQMGKGAPEMILGRALDMASVGIFSRGAGMIEVFHRLVLRTAMPVALPYFARSVREEGTPRRGMLMAMTYLTGVGWPFMACMAVGAFAAIRLMYGPQWMAAVGLAKLLCAVAAIELMYFPAKEALLAQGGARDSFWLQLSMQGQRVLGLFLAIPFGLYGACWGLLAAALGGALHSHLVLSRLTKMTWKDVWDATAASAVVALAAAAPLLAWSLFMPIDESNYIVVALAAVPACGLCWLAALRFSGHPLWRELLRVWAAVMTKLGRGKQTP